MNRDDSMSKNVCNLPPAAAPAGPSGQALSFTCAGRKPDDPTFFNTCYSVVGEDFGISVAAVYCLNSHTNTIEAIPNSDGVSPANASLEIRKREVSYAHSWFNLESSVDRFVR